jgi:hypothetical protein
MEVDERINDRLEDVNSKLMQSTKRKKLFADPESEFKSKSSRNQSRRLLARRRREPSLVEISNSRS